MLYRTSTLVVAIALLSAGHVAAQKPLGGTDWQIPDPRLKQPFAAEVPIRFVSSATGAEWAKLTAFWTNNIPESVPDPMSGQAVQRKTIVIKVPLGLSQPPAVPSENPITAAKWSLGKKLYFDKILSSDTSISCATCHVPAKGFTDQRAVSTGIGSTRGNFATPSLINAAYLPQHTCEGRTHSLEEQSQAHVQSESEMFGGKGDAWSQAVERIRAKQDYVKLFEVVFGTQPTRDAIVKSIAAYERTILSGNSIHDRAEAAMLARVKADGSGKSELQAKDYQKVLSEAFVAKDTNALTALRLDPAADSGKAAEAAKNLAAGQELFFGKARCHQCHSGELFTDNQFHNLGVGIKDAQRPTDVLGRFAILPVGHKNTEMIGAFRTPSLRGLVNTAPYMHDGSEKTLEDVVDFYDRGGTVNDYLDVKMRNFDAERQLRESGQPRVVPRKLNLSPDEKRQLVLFLRSLQGDAVDRAITDEVWNPPVGR